MWNIFNIIPKISYCEFYTKVINGENLVLIKDKIYDISDLLNSHIHPGGQQVLLNAINEKTDQFKHVKFHKKNILQILKKNYKYKIYFCNCNICRNN